MNPLENASKTKKVVYTALFIALVYVCTAFVNIRLPIAANGGLVHLGNVPLFIVAILFGRRYGAVAGGVGMALFDLMGGWLAWAPFTLIVVAAMGWTVGWMTEKWPRFAGMVCAIAAACLIKIVGYYAAEAIIYGNWIIPASSVPGNLVQIAVAAVVTLPVAPKLKNLIKRL